MSDPVGRQRCRMTPPPPAAPSRRGYSRADVFAPSAFPCVARVVASFIDGGRHRDRRPRPLRPHWPSTSPRDVPAPRAPFEAWLFPCVRAPCVSLRRSTPGVAAPFINSGPHRDRRPRPLPAPLAVDGAARRPRPPLEARRVAAAFIDSGRHRDRRPRPLPAPLGIDGAALRHRPCVSLEALPFPPTPPARRGVLRQRRPPRPSTATAVGPVGRRRRRATPPSPASPSSASSSARTRSSPRRVPAPFFGSDHHRDRRL